MEAGRSLEPHGDPLDGVDRQRHRGESSGQHGARMLRELAEARNSKERAGARRPCSLCTGPLENVCGLFEASRTIRRTDPTGAVTYLGPRWYCCRECSALLRAAVNREELGAMAALGTRFVAAQRAKGAPDPAGTEMFSEFVGVVVELTRLLEGDGQISRLVPAPKWGPTRGE
ncbi:hypothetical protein DBB34_14575 [Sphaerisporangium cinnabarinum]|nr:hypothetical protein DBB34_14575 [Sphaerisporangium cinnabarinum]